MFESMKQRVRRFLTQTVVEANKDLRTSPATKASLRLLYNYYQSRASEGTRVNIEETGLRVYSQFEEDGLLMYIFASIGATTKTYVDIGCADGVYSNCATSL